MLQRPSCSIVFIFALCILLTRCLVNGSTTKKPTKSPTSAPTKSGDGSQETDGSALCDLYNGITNATDKSKLTNWCRSFDPCNATHEWAGVSCETVNGARRVTMVDLDELFDYESTIPQTIGNLDELTYLSIDISHLHGTLPSQLGMLSKLEYLSFYRNYLTGAIPSALGSLYALTWLDLSSNSLGGTLPLQLWGLTTLDELDLYDNHFSGSLSTLIGSLLWLTSLSLWGSSLSGTIPTQLAMLSNLEYLELNSNSFTGALPVDVSAIDSLSYLDVSFNSLSGSLPSRFGEQLQYLDASNNLFRGSLPVTIASGALTALDISKNSLSGSLPYQLGLLTVLDELDLSSNAFTSTVPASFCSFNHTITLWLGNNPGLTCLPSCLSKPPYESLNSTITAVCGGSSSFPTLAPTLTSLPAQSPTLTPASGGSGRGEKGGLSPSPSQPPSLTSSSSTASMFSVNATELGVGVGVSLMLLLFFCTGLVYYVRVYRIRSAKEAGLAHQDQEQERTRDEIPAAQEGGWRTSDHVRPALNRKTLTQVPAPGGGLGRVSISAPSAMYPVGDHL